MHRQYSSRPSRRYKTVLLALSLLFLFISTEVVLAYVSSTPAPEKSGFMEIAQQPSKSPVTGEEKSPAPKPTASKSGEASVSPAASKSPGEVPSGSPSAAPSEEGSPAASPAGEPSPATSESPAPVEPARTGFDIMQYQDYFIPVAAGVGGLIVLLIILLIVLKRKKRHVCEHCGKQVFPGMVYCEDCSGQEISKPDEKKVTSPISTLPREREDIKPKRDERPPETPKVKTRPTGRVIAVITVRRGANQGYRLNFYESLRQITIGSDPECDMAIQEDEEVSARHAVITMSEDTSFLIHDMGNTSGLFVNNERVNKSGLKSGDVIRVGKTELTFARL